MFEDLFRSLQGRPVDLLPLDQVRERLHLRQLVDRGIQEVALNEIVGSLGRAREFNRAFLPRKEASRNRWQQMKELAEGPGGFPPIELYFVTRAYFVVDGHHRVSVARAVGAQTIEAHVKEYISPVLLSSETSIEELLLKGGLTDFLEATELVQNSTLDYVTTEVNGYEKLLDHISVHRYYRGIELQRDISWQEAVRSWHDSVYLPMVSVIRKHQILTIFPGRTETDLYLFTMDHLHHLRQRYAAKNVSAESAARHFTRVRRAQTKPASWWKRKKRSES